MKTLIAILLLFSFSYCLRIIIDKIFLRPDGIVAPFSLCTIESTGEEVAAVHFSSSMFFLVDAVFYDMVPIGAVLLFHKYNYTTKLNGRVPGPGANEELRSNSGITDHEIFLIHKMRQSA